MRKTREELYKLSYEFYETKLWERMSESDCYALRIDDERTLYIQILGMVSGNGGINVFPSKEDLLRCNHADIQDDIDIFMYMHSFQMLFFTKSDFQFEEEYEEAKQYVKDAGLKFRKYPEFLKCVPYYARWYTEEEDEEILLKAIESAVLIAKQFQFKHPQEIGITSMDIQPFEAAVFSMNDGWIQKTGTCEIDFNNEEFEEVYPAPFAKTALLDEIRQFKQDKTFECELVRIKQLRWDEENLHAPYLPVDLIFAEKSKGEILEIGECCYYETEADAYFEEFCEAMIQRKWYPKTIRCEDSRTYYFLKDFADQLNIKLSVYKGKMRALEEAKAYLLRENSFDEMEQLGKMIQMLLSMPDDSIKDLPDDILRELRILASSDLLKPEIEKKLKRKLGL